MPSFGRFVVPLISFFLVVLLVDCRVDLVTSLQPIYTEDTLITYPGLEGRWQWLEDTSDYQVVMDLSPTKGKTYLLRYRVVSLDGKVHLEVPFTAHLVRIGEQTYLDIYSEKAFQRGQLLVKKNHEALDEAVSYGIGVDTELKEFATGLFLINSVEKGSSADLGELRIGDRVIKVNGHSVESITRNEFTSHTLGPEGSQVTYTITREEGAEALEFSLIRNSKRYHWLSDEDAIGQYGVGVWGGFFDTALTVKTVQPGSPAEVAGIQPGDRITEANGRSLEWVSRYEAPQLLHGLEGSQIDIVVVPEGASQPVSYSLRRDFLPPMETSKSFAEELAEREGAYPEIYRRFWLGSHVFARVEIGEDALSLVGLNAGWLVDLLETQPDVLSHTGAPEDILVLTSPPDELHRFLLRFGSNQEAFSDSSTLSFSRVEGEK